MEAMIEALKLLQVPALVLAGIVIILQHIRASHRDDVYDKHVSQLTSHLLELVKGHERLTTMIEHLVNKN